MKHTGFHLIFVVIVLAVLVPGSRGAEPAAEDIGPWYDHCVQPVDGGSVDWTDGMLLANGHGYAKGWSEQQRQMAQRAAELDAARNILALAVGMPVGEDGPLGGLRSGRVMIDGKLLGHKIIETKWLPGLQPPEARVTVGAPLWGAKSISFRIINDCRHSAARRGGRKVTLNSTSVDVSDAILVIDARGTGMQPCLFPEIVREDGAMLYNINTLTHKTSVGVPLAKFVKSSLLFEDLQDCDGQPGLAVAEEIKIDSNGHRWVVRATSVAGNHKTQAVISREDADKIGASPKGSSLLRNAKVMIVVGSIPESTKPEKENLETGEAEEETLVLRR